MNRRADVEEFVRQAKEYSVLDVRSPDEYAKGHIPGAISFPLFDNRERAEIGTLYKQVGQSAAIERGMSMIQPRIQDMYKEGISHAKGGKLLVHCWRGGKRSESVAAMLAISGMDVLTLNQGYKAFRRWVLEQFSIPYPIRIIGGATGSGKTEILHQLTAMGQRTVDLEGLADHRGSSFGRLGSTRQVRPAQFENDLAWELYFTEGAPLWLEDESRSIGSLYIPMDFWNQMDASEVYYIELPKEVRIQRLVQDYAHFSKEELVASVERISRRLGGARTQEVMAAFERNDVHTTVSLLLDYYDKSYGHATKRRPAENVIRIPFDDFDAEKIAKTLIEAGRA
jgi:tRNA 2-selenouridine synthase